MSKKTSTILIVLAMCSLLFIQAAVSNYYRSDLSDRFNDASFDATKWSYYFIEGGGATCVNSYTSESITETTYLTQSASGIGGDGANHCSAVAQSYSVKNYLQPFKKWDIYMTANSTNTVTFGDGAYAKSSIVIYNSSEVVGTLFISENGLSVPNTIWHIVVSDGTNNATLYNQDGSINNSVDISSYSNWSIGWRNYGVGWHTGAHSDTGTSITRISNISVFETDLPLLVDTNTYDANAWETSYETFEQGITFDNSTYQNIVADLYYDDSKHSAEVSITGDTATITSSFDLPSVSSDTTKNFNYVYYLSGTGGSVTTNSSTYSQVVNKTYFNICNATYSTAYVNFTTKEEGSLIEMNSSVNIVFNYWLGNGNTYALSSYSNLNDNESRFNFCFNPNNLNITVGAVIEYSYTNYSSRSYYLDDALLTPVGQNIDLYLLTENSSSAITFQVIDENYNPIFGAYVRILRWDYLTDSFYTTSMIRTDVEGKGVGLVRLYDAYYKYQVVYNGKVYLTTVAAVETETTRTLQIALNTVSPYILFNNISYDFTYSNNSQSFLLTWADTSGLVATGCLAVIRSDVSNTTRISYECSTSTSGTLSYTLTQNGTYVGQAIFRLNEEGGYVEKVVKTIIITLGKPSRFTTVGTYGQVAGLLLIGTLTLLGVAAGSIILAVVLMIVGVVMAYLLGILYFSPTVIYSLIGIALIVAFTSKRRNE